jgi:ribonuclease BN (tRNA processing enzyme)
MKVTLLGTGTPTNPHRFQSSALIEIDESKLLFDAGRGFETETKIYCLWLTIGV